MSSTDLDVAIEQIRTDHDLALAVAQQGGSALGGFDLTEPERSDIADAFRRDIEEATDEVAGFEHGLPDGMPVPNLMGLGTTAHDFSFVKKVDKASPVLLQTCWAPGH